MSHSGPIRDTAADWTRPDGGFRDPARESQRRRAFAASTVMIMDGAQDDSWQKRYEAEAGREQAGNGSWMQQWFGVSLRRTMFLALPEMLTAFLVGLLFQGWLHGVVLAAVLLAVVLVVRVWVRRRHGITTKRPAQWS